MANKVERVKGRGGESMELSEGIVSFRTGGRTYTMPVDDVAIMEVMNAEDARSFAESAPVTVRGLWVYNEMPSSKGKSAYLVARGTQDCWIMEVNKTQAPNAVKLAFAVIPPKSKEEEEEEIRLYAAIQTPLGAVFTVGSIACVLGAYYCIGMVRQPIIGLVLAAAAIYMFTHIK